jgi:hypothetical protein
MLQKYLDVRPPRLPISEHEREPIRENGLPTTRNGLGMAGDMTNKQADPEYEHMKELAAMCHYGSCQRDCTKMLDLALVSQAFAVLRPPFPVKAAPPFSGEVIIIGDDLARGGSAKKPLNIMQVGTVPF